MIRLATLSAAAFFLALASPALADPCEGPLPTKEGVTFSGKVRYSGDGDMVCVSDSADPATWIEVRLADFYAPESDQPGGREAKAALARIAMNKPVVCTVVRGDHGKTTSWDRVIAVCRLNGQSVGDLLRREGVPESGNGYKGKP